MTFLVRQRENREQHARACLKAPTLSFLSNLSTHSSLLLLFLQLIRQVSSERTRVKVGEVGSRYWLTGMRGGVTAAS